MNPGEQMGGMALKTIREAACRTPLAALVLIVAAWVVYQPAMNRLFAADQVWYFAELDGQTSLSAGLQQWDYGVTRRYWKGDGALFRPLSFAWLAVGNALFSYHHIWWNIANLALHVLVGMCLFWFLRTIRRSPSALLVAFLFVVMKPCFELVLWNHLGGYMLACAFFFVGMRAFVLRLRCSGEPSFWVNVTYAMAMTSATLCHEAMVPTTLLASATLVWTERSHKPRLAGLLPLALPILVFAVLYAFHAMRVERPGYANVPGSESIFGFANLIRVIPESVKTVARWLVETSCPSALHLADKPYLRMLKIFRISPESWRDLALTVGLLIVWAFTISGKHLKSVFPILIVLATGLFSYVGLICLGRAPEEVDRNAYYLYFVPLFAAPMMYVLVDPERLKPWINQGFTILLAALIFLHTTETSITAADVGRANAAASDYLAAVAKFVDAHRANEHFTFAIENAPESLDPVFTLKEGYPDEPAAPVHHLRATEILFSRYYTETPKVVFRY